MVLEYFTRKPQQRPAQKENEAMKSPVLNDEDEKFLTHITSDEGAPPLPEQSTVILDTGEEVEGRDAQAALMDGAEQIPLPTSPPVDEHGNPIEEKGISEEERNGGITGPLSLPCPTWASRARRR